MRNYSGILVFSLLALGLTIQTVNTTQSVMGINHSSTLNADVSSDIIPHRASGRIA